MSVNGLVRGSANRNSYARTSQPRKAAPIDGYARSSLHDSVRAVVGRNRRPFALDATLSGVVIHAAVRPKLYAARGSRAAGGQRCLAWTRRSTAWGAVRWKSLSRTQVGVTMTRTIES
jgi:hypothetical protein